MRNLNVLSNSSYLVLWCKKTKLRFTYIWKSLYHYINKSLRLFNFSWHIVLKFAGLIFRTILIFSTYAMSAFSRNNILTPVVSHIKFILKVQYVHPLLKSYLHRCLIPFLYFSNRMTQRSHFPKFWSCSHGGGFSESEKVA